MWDAQVFCSYRWLPAPRSTFDSMLPSPVSSSPSPHTLLSSRRSFLPCPAASALNFFGTASDHFLYPRRHASPPLCAAGLRAIAEVVTGSRKDAKEEEDVSDLKFIDVGFISSVHGLKGELRVKPNTGFPELRFCKPGRRWLRARILGRETISEVQLTSGRNHPGQKCWIIRFEGVDTVDKAKLMVGSTLLVREGDRPELQEDEFYTHDLVGMRVILKETGTLVGTVANVVNSGANDLLYVMRASSDTCINPLDHSGSPMSEKRTDASGQFLWIPFVEAIVPEVDNERREMIITPPKGLLELNLRSDTRSKKERRQMEWKQRKKLQHRFNAAKKMLHEMGQSHLVDGFSIGEKDQKDKLARQIANVNLRLFQHAVQNVESSSMRLSLFDFVAANSDLLLKNALKIPHKYLLDCAYSEKNSELFKEGLQLLRNSKAAITLVVKDDRNLGEFANHKLQKLLLDYRRFLKCEEKNIEIPLIIMTSTDQIRSSEQFLLDNDYFGFNAEKVLFTEETMLPVARKSAGSDKILLKSPWEILEAPTGSGGIFASLASHKGVEFLQKMGVEYVQVCAVGEVSAFGSPLFFGQASSCKADISLKIIEDGKDEDRYDMIFSIGQMIKICKQAEALSFQAVLEQHEHVEMVDGEWTEIKPISPNSYSLRCSIYDVLNSCSIDKVSIMQVYA